MGFLRQRTGKTAKRQRDGYWRSVAEASVIKEVIDSGGVGVIEADT